MARLCAFLAFFCAISALPTETKKLYVSVEGLEEGRREKYLALRTIMNACSKVEGIHFSIMDKKNKAFFHSGLGLSNTYVLSMKYSFKESDFGLEAVLFDGKNKKILRRASKNNIPLDEFLQSTSFALNALLKTL